MKKVIYISLYIAFWALVFLCVLPVFLKMNRSQKDAYIYMAIRKDLDILPYLLIIILKYQDKFHFYRTKLAKL